MASARSEGVRGRVFVVDDEPEQQRVIVRALSRAGFDVHTFESAILALNALEAVGGEVDVVLADIYMPDMTGLELLSVLQDRWSDLIVVMMTGAADVSTAVEAMRGGAYDYLVKPIDALQTLLPVMRRAVEHKLLCDRNRYLERQLHIAERFAGLIGNSKAMRKVYSLIESVAPTDATVLISGDSGTGKELVARSIHKQSRRSKKPFVDINCGALVENILESELFGHVRGAFTGATTSRRGLFEEASGGTLFLDEVGELSAATQVRLLRVLQEGTIRPVGSNESREVDVRIIAATNRSLKKDVERGMFRQDLYYRLDVVTVELPPLQQRIEDIPPLAHHFVKKHAARLGKSVASIEPDVLERLCAYSWPGNVRELENLIERAIVLAKGVTVSADLLPSSLTATTSLSVPRWPHRGLLPLARAKAEFEKLYLEQILHQAKGNVTEAARLAGVDRSNFRRLLRRRNVELRPAKAG